MIVRSSKKNLQTKNSLIVSHKDYKRKTTLSSPAFFNTSDGMPTPKDENEFFVSVVKEIFREICPKSSTLKEEPHFCFQVSLYAIFDTKGQHKPFLFLMMLL